MRAWIGRSARSWRSALLYFGELLDCVDASLGDCNNTAESKEFIMGRLEHIFGEAFSLVSGTYTRGSASCATLPVLPELDPGAAEPVNNLVEYGILVMQLSFIVGMLIVLFHDLLATDTQTVAASPRRGGLVAKVLVC
ncbi:hypothetical protein HPB51_017829 [Rhipicephalus microplus]|uniref:Uncharacterized protein n=1 Tax=Rhipicephalus microplus TaxID=6941 RepID=A0A9J6E244_RHIMP|nr:hypothetical protein HPB51_017829 [Rhipicephalus microplus]